MSTPPTPESMDRGGKGKTAIPEEKADEPSLLPMTPESKQLAAVIATGLVACCLLSVCATDCGRQPISGCNRSAACGEKAPKHPGWAHTTVGPRPGPRAPGRPLPPAARLPGLPGCPLRELELGNTTHAMRSAGGEERSKTRAPPIPFSQGILLADDASSLASHCDSECEARGRAAAQTGRV